MYYPKRPTQLCINTKHKYVLQVRDVPQIEVLEILLNKPSWSNVSDFDYLSLDLHQHNILFFNYIQFTINNGVSFVEIFESMRC